MEKLTLHRTRRHTLARVQPILDPSRAALGGCPEPVFVWRRKPFSRADGGTAKAATSISSPKRGSGLRRALEKEYANSFAAACERAGALEIEYLPLTATITVTFPEGDWDLSELEPPLPGQEGLAEVDGAKIQTLSTAPNPRGKTDSSRLSGGSPRYFRLAVALYARQTGFRSGRKPVSPGRI